MNTTKIEDTKNPATPRRFAVWPPVVLTVLYWIGYWTPAWLQLPISSGFFSVVIGGGLFVLLFTGWWLSRGAISRSERLLTFAALFVGLVSAVFYSDHSLGPMGVLFFGLPHLLTFWTGALVLSRNLAANVRAPLTSAAFGIVFIGLGVIRTDGVDGYQHADIRWRWAITKGELYLADLAKRSKEPAGDAAASTAVLAAQPGDWTQFRGADRDGAVHGVRLDTDWTAHPPKKIWRQRVGPAWSSIVIIGDRLFTQEQRGEQEAVVCLDAATGREIWAHLDDASFSDGQAGPGPRATPTFHAGRLYTFGATGILNCLDAATGKLHWTANVKTDSGASLPMWGFSSSPLVVDGLVVVNSGGKDDKGLFAYNAESGKPVWNAPSGPMSYSSAQLVTLDGQRQIAFLGDSGASGLEIATGKSLWQYAAPGKSWRAAIPCAVGASQLLIGSEDLGLVQLDVARGGKGWTAARKWATNNMKPAYNDVVVQDGFAYGLDGYILCCVDLATGQRRWKGGRYGHGQILLLADQPLLLVLSEKGDVALVACNPEKSEELARFQAIEGKTWNHPTLSRGRLYVRNDEEMACYEVTGKE